MTNLNDLKIKIFLDTANLESIQQCKKNTLMLEVLQQTQA